MDFGVVIEEMINVNDITTSSNSSHHDDELYDCFDYHNYGKKEEEYETEMQKIMSDMHNDSIIINSSSSMNIVEEESSSSYYKDELPSGSSYETFYYFQPEDMIQQQDNTVFFGDHNIISSNISSNIIDETPNHEEDHANTRDSINNSSNDALLLISNKYDMITKRMIRFMMAKCPQVLGWVNEFEKQTLHKSSMLLMSNQQCPNLSSSSDVVNIESNSSLYDATAVADSSMMRHDIQMNYSRKRRLLFNTMRIIQEPTYQILKKIGTILDRNVIRYGCNSIANVKTFVNVSSYVKQNKNRKKQFDPMFLLQIFDRRKKVEALYNSRKKRLEYHNWSKQDKKRYWSLHSNYVSTAATADAAKEDTINKIHPQQRANYNNEISNNNSIIDYSTPPSYIIRDDDANCYLNDIGSIIDHSNDYSNDYSSYSADSTDFSMSKSSINTHSFMLSSPSCIGSSSSNISSISSISSNILGINFLVETAMNLPDDQRQHQQQHLHHQSHFVVKKRRKCNELFKKKVESMMPTILTTNDSRSDILDNLFNNKTLMNYRLVSSGHNYSIKPRLNGNIYDKRLFLRNDLVDAAAASDISYTTVPDTTLSASSATAVSAAATVSLSFFKSIEASSTNSILLSNIEPPSHWFTKLNGYADYGNGTFHFPVVMPEGYESFSSRTISRKKLPFQYFLFMAAKVAYKRATGSLSPEHIHDDGLEHIIQALEGRRMLDSREHTPRKITHTQTKELLHAWIQVYIFKRQECMRILKYYLYAGYVVTITKGHGGLHSKTSHASYNAPSSSSMSRYTPQQYIHDDDDNGT